MAILHDINHNAGGAVTNFWDNETDPSGGVAVKVAAGLNGTANGLAMDLSTNDDMRVDSSWTSPASNEVRFRCYFDPNSNSDNDAYTMMEIGIEEVATGDRFIVVQISAIFADRVVQIFYGIDGGESGFGVVTITDASHCIEVELIRASSAIANDGEARWWLDSVLQDEVTNVDLFDDWSTYDEIFTDAVNKARGDRDFYIDEIFVTDVAGTSLGCSPVIATDLTLAPMLKPADIDADDTFIYVALLEGTFPIITKINTSLLVDGVTVFDPGAGDNIGVQCARFDVDTVWIAGAFGGTNVVEKSENAGTTFTVKDDTTIGEVRTFIVGPDSDKRILVATEDGFLTDIEETIDDGTNWSAIHNDFAQTIFAVDRLSTNVQESVFGHDAAVDRNPQYSINSGADLQDFGAGFPLQDVTHIIVN